MAKILYQCKENNCKTVTFTGGEPLVHKELIDFAIDYLNKSNYEPDVKIITNGSLIDTEFIKNIKSYKGDLKVNLSLHSMNENIYNKITKTNNNLIKTLKSIELLEREEIPLRLNYVVLKGINDTKEDIITLLLESLSRNVTAITFLELLMTEENKNNREYYLSYDEIKRTIENTCEQKGELIVEYENKKKIRYIFYTEKQKICLEVFRLTCMTGCKSCLSNKDRTIGPDGEYYPCFVKSDQICGNVSLDMREAFNSGDRIIEGYGKKYGDVSPIQVD